MKPGIFLLLAVLCLAGALTWSLSLRRWARKWVFVLRRLIKAHTDLQKQGSFKNDEPALCHIYACTQRHAAAGRDYQCELATQSRWFRGYGFAVITTGGVLLWVDKTGKVGPVEGFSERESHSS
jgi:hypothetical protein